MRRVLPAHHAREGHAQRGACYIPTMVRRATTRRVLPTYHGERHNEARATCPPCWVYTTMRVLPAHHVDDGAQRCASYPPTIVSRKEDHYAQHAST